MYGRDYSIMARLHVALPLQGGSFTRFVYISDMVARDAQKEREAIEKANRRRG